MTKHFPMIRSGMAAIAQAELADVMQLDLAIAKSDLQEKFEARVVAQAQAAVLSGSSSAIEEPGDYNEIHSQMLSKAQVALLVEELDAELTGQFSSFLMQNPSFLMKNSSFLMQNSDRSGPASSDGGHGSAAFRWH